VSRDEKYFKKCCVLLLLDFIIMPLNLKPTKPTVFEGRRNSLRIEPWLYQVQQYFTLVQVGSTGTPLDDGTMITYASSLFSKTAATWWYMLVQAGQVPTSWEAFMGKVRSEFIPQDHIRRSRDRLRKLRQRTSLVSYISEFRNIALTISGITEDEQFDRFCEGLKPEIKLEVQKSNAASFEAAARIALNVDSAYYGMQLNSSVKTYESSEGPTPMEIGNFQSSRKYPRKFNNSSRNQWKPQWFYRQKCGYT
jgi:hypothetical protein